MNWRKLYVVKFYFQPICRYISETVQGKNIVMESLLWKASRNSYMMYRMTNKYE